MGLKNKADGKIKWLVSGIPIDDFQKKLQQIISTEVMNETNYVKLNNNMTQREAINHFDIVILKTISEIIPPLLTELYVMCPDCLLEISLYDIVSANWVEIIADEFRNLMQYEVYNEITNRSNG